MAVEIFVRIVKRVFEKNCNSSQLAFPWSFLAMFLKSQPIDDVNVIAHIEPPHSVKRLYKFRSIRTEFSRGLQYTSK